MKKFNKYAALKKLDNKNNQKIKSITVIISVTLLICAIFYFSFARFEKAEVFSLINGSVSFNDSAKTTLISGPLFNKEIKILSGYIMSDSDIEKYNNQLLTKLLYFSILDDGGEQYYQEYINRYYGENGNAPTYEEYVSLFANLYEERFKINSSTMAQEDVYIANDINSYNICNSNICNDIAIKSIEYSANLPSSGIETKVVSTEDSQYEVIAWYENETIYLYSEANTIYMNPNSAHAFSGLTQLETVDLSRLDFRYCESLKSLFLFDKSLKSIDYSRMNTKNVKDMSWMFSNSFCYLDDYSVLNTSNTVDMRGMFATSVVKNADFSTLDTSNVENASQLFNDLTVYDAYVEIVNSNYNSMNSTQRTMFMNNLASKYSSRFNFANIDTSNMKYMSSMFMKAGFIKNLDLNNYDTSNVMTMDEMFMENDYLETINLSSFNTSNVVNMSYMFYSSIYSKITSLDVSNFNTSNVKDMSYMFSGLYGITNLDVSHFDTSKVTDMSFMFAGDSNLIDLDVSHFDTSKVVSMGYMFSGLQQLSSIDVSHFNTSNVTIMSDMFSTMRKITNLDVSNFDTSKVTEMDYMFSSCTSLTQLDIHNFNTSKVTNMNGMFAGLINATTIKVGNNWNTAKVTKSNRMFYNSTKLVGGSGTVFDANHIDKEYARVDDPANGNPGYLTLKS